MSTQKALSERLPEYIFDRIHQDIGQASACWTKLEKAGTFKSEDASKIAFNLCHFVADELDKLREKTEPPTDMVEAVKEILLKYYQADYYPNIRDDYTKEICSLFDYEGLREDIAKLIRCYYFHDDADIYRSDKTADQILSLIAGYRREK